MPAIRMPTTNAVRMPCDHSRAVRMPCARPQRMPHECPASFRMPHEGRTNAMRMPTTTAVRMPCECPANALRMLCECPANALRARARMLLRMPPVHSFRPPCPTFPPYFPTLGPRIQPFCFTPLAHHARRRGMAKLRCLGELVKLTWLVLGEDPAARSHRVEQFTAL